MKAITSLAEELTGPRTKRPHITPKAHATMQTASLRDEEYSTLCVHLVVQFPSVFRAISDAMIGR